MRARFVPVVLALVMALGGCASPETTSEATDAPAETLAETTIGPCVIAQGEIPPAEATGEDFETIKDGVLTVGSDTAFPPFESIEDGEAVGFDVDLMNAINEAMGGELQVEIQTAAFDTIFTALAAGKFDAVISAVTIKEERKQTVDFTDPYFDSDQSIAVRTEDAETITGVDDLGGKAVGVQAATTGRDCAKDVLEKDGKIGSVREYDTAVDAFTDLKAKRVDAVLVDLPTAQQIVENQGGATVVQAIRTQEKYGIAVSKENPNLRVAINDALAEVKDDGTYAELFKKWFDTEPPE